MAITTNDIIITDCEYNYDDACYNEYGVIERYFRNMKVNFLLFDDIRCEILLEQKIPLDDVSNIIVEKLNSRT